MRALTGAAIPLADLAAEHRDLEEELVGVFRASLRSAEFVGGQQVEAFEREFAQYCGTRFCVAVGSGTDALCLALVAMGIGAGDAVVTVAHTFIATVEAISHTGAEAEFVDIDERSCNMSVEALEAYLSRCRRDPASRRPIGASSGKPIKAILPVHLYGQIADIDALKAVADRFNLLLLEDACQAHGAEYRTRTGDWRRAGSFGNAAAFSFYPSKNLGACGDGGAVTTNDEAVARSVRMLRDHGQVEKYLHDRLGFNSRLDAVQAAILRVKLRRLDGWNDRRRTAAIRYNHLLSTVPDVLTPCEPSWSRAVHHLYVLRVAHRDALASALRSQGIQTGLHYPVPLHLQKACRRPETSLPVTVRVSSQILSLPMYSSITVDQQERICSAISTFAGASV